MEYQGEYRYRYPHAAITTDCVVFGYNGQELKVLLIRRGANPYKGKWAFPGGFLRMDETLEQCARRELMEETSFCPEMLEQFHAYSSVHRDPRERVVTVAFYALVKPAAVKGGDDADEAQWFEIHHVPPLAFDHDELLVQALRHLKEQVHFKPVCFKLLGDVFTLPQLQHIYETVLDTTFDRRNFQRKMSPVLIPAEAPRAEYEDLLVKRRQPVNEHSDRQHEKDMKILCCSTRMCGPKEKINSDKHSDGNENTVFFSVTGNPLPALRENLIIPKKNGEPDHVCDIEPSKREPGRKPQWFRFNLLRYLQLKQENEDKLDI